MIGSWGSAPAAHDGGGNGKSSPEQNERAAAGGEDVSFPVLADGGIVVLDL